MLFQPKETTECVLGIQAHAMNIWMLYTVHVWSSGLGHFLFFCFLIGLIPQPPRRIFHDCFMYLQKEVIKYDGAL